MFFHHHAMRVRFCHIICRHCSTVSSSLLLSHDNLHIFPRKSRTQAHKLSQLILSPPKKPDPKLYNKAVHAKLIIFGFESSTFLNNILISAYSKSGCFDYARNVFDKMPQRNSISWGSAVSMYFHHGCYEEALSVFLQFWSCSGESPEEFVIANVIRCCSRLGSEEMGVAMHGLVIKISFYRQVDVGTALVCFYSECSDIGIAKSVFDDQPVKNAATWSAIITAFARSGHNEISLRLFSQMREIGVVPDKYAIMSTLSSCLLLGFFEAGKQIHSYVLRCREEMDTLFSNALIDFYMKSGEVESGRTVFDQLVVKNVVTWTTIISGYMQNSFDSEAIDLFWNMWNLGLKPDSFTCCSVLISCGSCEALAEGTQVHAYTIKANLNRDNYVTNSLVDMYSKCNSLVDAKKAFDAMERNDVITYNSMIEGYYRRDMLEEALDLFVEMRINSIQPSLSSFITLLQVPASLASLVLCRKFHCLIIKFGFSRELFAGSTVVSVYSQCSSLGDARQVFKEMEEKDIVVWNSIMFGYVQHSHHDDATRLFLELQRTRLKPNEATFVALITTSGDLASLKLGVQFHTHLVKSGIGSDSFLSNALVYMYANCGNLKDARKVFDSSAQRDIACWNSMISTYAHHGEAHEAFRVFESLIDEGVEPDEITFVAVLSACSHAGLLEEGLFYFNSMSRFGIEPSREHYALLVSLLARAGKLSEAMRFIGQMQVEPTAILWRNVLGACRAWGDVELGEYAAEMVISVDPNDSGAYVSLSNLLASRCRWSDVREVRERMEKSGVAKETGMSWIEIDDDVHCFVSGDRSHFRTDEMYSLIEFLIVQMKGDRLLASFG